MPNITQEAGPDAARREIEHIAYLLAQLPQWRGKGWIAPSGAAAIGRHYAARRDALAERLRHAAGMAGRVGPVVPPLPAGSAPFPAALGGPLPRPAPPDAAPTRVFLRANGLKIVFALATLLTLAALRSLLQWGWADAILVHLLPAIPLLLTGLFWRFGEKTRAENRWAAFAFHGMACALLAFDLLAINRYWLFDAIPPRSLLALSFGAGTLAAGGLLRRHRETAYFYLFQSSLLLALYALLQNLRPLASDFWPRPLLLFGGAYLLAAAASLALALRARRAEVNAPASAEPGAFGSETWARWLHVCALIAGILALIGGFDGAENRHEWAILTLTAGVIFGAAAQGLNRARLAFVSGGGAAAGLVFALQTNSLLTMTAAGGAALVLCGAALALSFLNSRRGSAGEALARAWHYVALSGLLLATSAAWTGAIQRVLPPQPFAALDQARLAAACAGMFLLFAVRERRTEYLHGASLNGIVGLVCAALSLRLTANGLYAALTIYGLLWSALYLLAARKTREAACSSAAALALTLAGASNLSLVNPRWNGGFGLELLPLWTALFAPGVVFRHHPERERLYGRPLRRVAAFFSGLTLLALFPAELAGRFIGALQPFNFCTVTLLAYAALYGLVAWFRPTPKTIFAAALTLTGAYLHHLLTLTGTSDAPGAISWPRFAFLAVQAGAFWLAVGWNVRRKLGKPELAQPILLLAGIVALGAAAAAFVTAQTPNEGRWTILTLAWSGAVWFGLWMLETGEICLHVGAWNLLISWMLLVYDRCGANRDALDIHLLPVALYLLLLGFREGRRELLDRAQGFWIVGWLLLLTPPFLAYWQGGAAWHTPLFLIECVFAVVFGAAWRIRAFFGSGLLFAGLYAAGHLVGRLPEAWGTFGALLLGVGLFAAGFYALTRRETVQKWTAALETQWRSWR